MPSNHVPTTKPRKRRLFLKVTAWLLGTLLLVLLSFPWWSPSAARLVASRVDGLSIESIETRGWDRWTATGIRFEQPGIAFTADRAELPSPTDILLRRSRAKPIALEHWTLRLDPASPADERPKTSALGPSDLYDLIDTYWAVLDTYPASLEAKSGRIVLNDKEHAQLERVTLDANGLQIEGRATAIDSPITLRIDRRPNAERLEILLAASHYDSKAKLSLQRESESILLHADLDLDGNHVSAMARWSKSPDWIPQQAKFGTDAFRIDERLPSWPADLPLLAQLTFDWAADAYQFELTARPVDADPTERNDIQLTGHGDLESVHIDAGRIRLPWLSATLDAPLDIAYSLEDPLQKSHAQLSINLAELPWIEGHGTLQVDLQTFARKDGQPEARLRVDSQDAALYGTRFSKLEASLALLGRQLEISKLVAETESGSELSAHATIDLDRKTIAKGHLAGTFQDESDRLRALLPLESWQTLSVEADFAGPLLDPEIEASARLEKAAVPALQALDLDLTLAGRLQRFTLNLDVANTVASAKAKANVTLSSEATTVEIDTLTIEYADGKAFYLDAPTTLRSEAGTGRIELNGLELVDDTDSLLNIARLDLAADRFIVDLVAQDFPTSIISAWLTTPLPDFLLKQTTAQFEFSPERSSALTSGEIDWNIGKETPIEVSWSAAQQQSDTPQLEIETLTISSQTRSILEAKGELPLALLWANRTFEYTLSDSAPFHLELNSSPHPDFWDAAKRILPVALTKPVIQADLSGTLSEPSGQASVKLELLRWRDPDAPEREVTLSDIAFVISAEPTRIEASSFSARIGSNRIQANATLPLKGSSLVELIRAKSYPSLDQLNGKASITLSDLPAVAGWLPDFARTEGSISMEVEFQPKSIKGVARLAGLSTRPLPPLGAISDIQGELSFENGRFHTEKITGLAEQSPFTLAGDVDLTKVKAPAYNLAFRSDNFPLIRDTGMLLTGDLDIHLKSKGAEPPIISGNLLLTKGLFLAEPDLLTSTAKTNASRPPYFSVSQEPFSEWGLDVTIRGDDFMRVSNSYFQGTLSADFRLEGTLQTPLLVGKAVANSGRINFPATSLALTTGEISITRDRPTEIQIEATATGRLFGYDANLNVSGEAADPEVSVTTNPALTQVEALLLVTTGALPNAQGGLAQKSATSLGLYFGRGLFRKLLPTGNSNNAERFDLEVGSDISLQGKSTIEARYRITDTVTVEGEYDKRDEYNANLKWTFYKK